MNMKAEHVRVCRPDWIMSGTSLHNYRHNSTHCYGIGWNIADDECPITAIHSYCIMQTKLKKRSRNSFSLSTPVKTMLNSGIWMLLFFLGNCNKHLGRLVETAFIYVYCIWLNVTRVKVNITSWSFHLVVR